MNTLTLLEIINNAARATRKGELASLDEETANGKTGRAYLKRVFQKLLACYPWYNMAQRVKLDEDGTPNSASRYTLRYSIPSDAMAIWDIYNNASEYKKYGYIWDYHPRRSYTWPYDDLSGIIGGLGEIVDGHIESDYSPLYVLYTPQIDVFQFDVTKLSVQFVEVLINEISMLYEGSNTDAELKKLNIRQHDNEVKRMQTNASIQNRKAHRVKQPHVIELIRYFLR